MVLVVEVSARQTNHLRPSRERTNRLVSSARFLHAPRGQGLKDKYWVRCCHLQLRLAQPQALTRGLKPWCKRVNTFRLSILIRKYLHTGFLLFVCSNTHYKPRCATRLAGLHLPQLPIIPAMVSGMSYQAFLFSVLPSACSFLAWNCCQMSVVTIREIKGVIG